MNDKRKRINDGGPAFMQPDDVAIEGMSLRAYIAARVLAAIVGISNGENRKTDASDAVSYADALIAELERGTP